MNTYNIFMPPDANRDSDISSAIFLPDNLAWIAGFVPPLWLIWHRLWWALTFYVAFLVIIFLIILSPWQLAAIFLSGIPGLYLLLEGHELVRQKHENMGWRQIGVVQANNEEDALLRHIHNLQYPDHNSQYDPMNVQTPVQQKRPENIMEQQNNRPDSIGIFPIGDPS